MYNVCSHLFPPLSFVVFSRVFLLARRGEDTRRYLYPGTDFGLLRKYGYWFAFSFRRYLYLLILLLFHDDCSNFFLFSIVYIIISLKTVSMIRVINLEKQFKTLWIILKSKQSSGSFRFQISNGRGRRINGGASARELISRRWSWGEGERGSRFVSSRDYLYTSNRPRDLNFWNGRFARPTGWSAAK